MISNFGETLDLDVSLVVGHAVNITVDKIDI